VLEGWQKFWEQPPESAQALGIAPANIKWLKTNETYGLFERASKYKNVRGEMAERKLFKENMEFHPACHVPNCGGQRKRYTPSKDKVAGSTQKIFSY